MGDVVAFQKGGYIAPFGGVIDKDLDRKGFAGAAWSLAPWAWAAACRVACPCTHVPTIGPNRAASGSDVGARVGVGVGVGVIPSSSQTSVGNGDSWERRSGGSAP